MSSAKTKRPNIILSRLSDTLQVLRSIFSVEVDTSENELDKYLNNPETKDIAYELKRSSTELDQQASTYQASIGMMNSIPKKNIPNTGITQIKKPAIGSDRQIDRNIQIFKSEDLDR